ncbi:MAG: hypothetical protein MR507_01520, partial [Succinivibrio sp.]|nr:hypothetical protein [Succinivibrio sp.]
ALVGISIILATLTFYFIEPPLRYGKAPRIKAVALFAVLLGLGAFGYLLCRGTIKSSNSYETEFGGNRLDPVYLNNCSLKFKNSIKNNELPCLMKNLPGNNDVAFIGDSHSSALAHGLFNEFKNSKHSLEILPVSGQCPFEYCSVKIQGKENWFRHVKNYIDYAVNDDNVSLIILTHYPWADYSDELTKDDNSDQYQTLYKLALRTFDKILKKDKRVLFLLDVPSMLDGSLYSKYRKSMRFSRISNHKFFKDEFTNSNVRKVFSRAVIDAAENFTNVKVINLTDFLCDNKNCFLFNEKGLPLYSDQHHLSIFGSDYVAKKLFKVIDNSFTEFK